MNSARFAAVFSVLMLAACSGNTVKDTLGLTRAAPDEFRVVSRPPLSVPPQFNLRAPDATAAAPGQTPADQAAKSALTGQENTFILPAKENAAAAPVAASAKPSSPEDNFLRKAGAAAADANIRNELIEERVTKQQEEEESSWWDILSTKPAKKDPTVDAKGEAERIQKNEDEGKPVTEGDTPEVKGKDTGILGRILGD